MTLRKIKYLNIDPRKQEHDLCAEKHTLLRKGRFGSWIEVWMHNTLACNNNANIPLLNPLAHASLCFFLRIISCHCQAGKESKQASRVLSLVSFGRHSSLGRQLSVTAPHYEDWGQWLGHHLTYIKRHIPIIRLLVCAVKKASCRNLCQGSC